MIRFCPRCGHEIVSVPQPASAGSGAPGYQAPGTGPGGSPGRTVSGPGLREQVTAYQQRLPGQLARIPPELLAVCALMALAGALLLWPVVLFLQAASNLIGAGSPWFAIGLLLLDGALLFGAVGAGLVILAWRLTKADRVARGLSYILLGDLACTVLLGGDFPAGLVVTMLLSLASLAVLGFAPAVRQFFTGPAAPHASQGISVTIARTLITWFAVAFVIVGITFLPMGVLGAKMVIAGIVFVGVGVGVQVLSARLAAGDANARQITSGLMGLYVILALIAAGRGPSGLMGVVIAVAVVALLWLPQDAQRHFGRQPQAWGQTGASGTPS